MRNLNLNELHAISGGTDRVSQSHSFTNSFIAGMQGADYNFFTSIDAIIGGVVCGGIGTFLGSVGGPVGAFIGGATGVSIGVLFGAAFSANEYHLGANYLQAMKIVNG